MYIGSIPNEVAAEYGLVSSPGRPPMGRSCTSFCPPSSAIQRAKVSRSQMSPIPQLRFVRTEKSGISTPAMRRGSRRRDEGGMLEIPGRDGEDIVADVYHAHAREWTRADVGFAR